MGLAIDGNEVHGIARGGQAFVSIGNVNSTDGSLNIGGQYYLNESKMKIKDTGEFNIDFSSDYYGKITNPQIDVTNNLSNYGGCLAICVIRTGSVVIGEELTRSLPIIIPTAPTTNDLDLSFDLAGWSGSLSRTTDSRFIFSPKYTNTMLTAPSGTGYFYILSNN